MTHITVGPFSSKTKYDVHSNSRHAEGRPATYSAIVGNAVDLLLAFDAGAMPVSITFSFAVANPLDYASSNCRHFQRLARLMVHF
jgi:hypothetical protein